MLESDGPDNYFQHIIRLFHMSPEAFAFVRNASHCPPTTRGTDVYMVNVLMADREILRIDGVESQAPKNLVVPNILH